MIYPRKKRGARVIATTDTTTILNQIERQPGACHRRDGQQTGTEYDGIRWYGDRQH